MPKHCEVSSHSTPTAFSLVRKSKKTYVDREKKNSEKKDPKTIN